MLVEEKSRHWWWMLCYRRGMANIGEYILEGDFGASNHKVASSFVLLLNHVAVADEAQSKPGEPEKFHKRSLWKFVFIVCESIIIDMCSGYIYAYIYILDVHIP